MNTIQFTDVGLTKIPRFFEKNAFITQYSFKTSHNTLVNLSTLQDINPYTYKGIVHVLKLESSMLFLLKVPKTHATQSIRGFGIFDDDSQLIIVGNLESPLSAGMDQIILIQYDLITNRFIYSISEFLEFSSVIATSKVLKILYDELVKVLENKVYADQSNKLRKILDDSDDLTAQRAEHFNSYNQEEFIVWANDNISSDPIRISDGYILDENNQNTLVFGNTNKVESHTYQDLIQRLSSQYIYDVVVSTTNYVTQAENISFDVFTKNAKHDVSGLVKDQFLDHVVTQVTNSTIPNYFDNLITHHILPHFVTIKSPDIIHPGETVTVSLEYPESIFKDGLKVSWHLTPGDIESNEQEFVFVCPNLGDASNVTIKATYSSSTTDNTFSISKQVRVSTADPLFVDIEYDRKVLELSTSDIVFHLTGGHVNDSYFFDIEPISNAQYITIEQDGTSYNIFHIHYHNVPHEKSLLLKCTVKSTRYNYSIVKYISIHITQNSFYCLKFPSYIQKLYNNTLGSQFVISTSPLESSEYASVYYFDQLSIIQSFDIVASNIILTYIHPDSQIRTMCGLSNGFCFLIKNESGILFDVSSEITNEFILGNYRILPLKNDGYLKIDLNSGYTEHISFSSVFDTVMFQLGTDLFMIAFVPIDSSKSYVILFRLDPATGIPSTYYLCELPYSVISIYDFTQYQHFIYLSCYCKTNTEEASHIFIVNLQNYDINITEPIEGLTSSSINYDHTKVIVSQLTDFGKILSASDGTRKLEFHIDTKTVPYLITDESRIFVRSLSKWNQLYNYNTIFMYKEFQTEMMNLNQSVCNIQQSVSQLFEIHIQTSLQFVQGQYWISRAPIQTDSFKFLITNNTYPHVEILSF